MPGLGVTSSKIGSIKSKLKYSCKYPSCNSSYWSNVSPTSQFKNKLFHRFPRHVISLSAWKRVCLISPSKNCANLYVCTDHFSKEDYSNTNEPTRLRYGAVPHTPDKKSFVVRPNIQCPRVLFPDQEPSTSVSDDIFTNEQSLVETCISLPSTSFQSESFPKTSNIDNIPGFQITSNFSEPLFYLPDPISEEVVISEDPDICLPKGISEEVLIPEEPGIVSGSDHSYCKPSTSFSKCSKMAFKDQYSFLEDTRDTSIDTPGTGILSKAGLSKKDLSPQGLIMYNHHRNVVSKLSKLRAVLKNKNADLSAIKSLYKDGRFQFIEENLNEITQDFINAQLRNFDKHPNARRWTIKDKAFSLSIYKRSPRLYRYLRSFFQLPSIRTLKTILSALPIDSGIIEPVLEHLKKQVENMDTLERSCTLIFDEMFLSAGLHYETKAQKICGFEDMGSFGRTKDPANHVLMFMIRGIKKSYKMPIAFYFTKTTIKSEILKQLIVNIITRLQEVGLNIVATVCDQGTTNQKALRLLTEENTDNPTSYHFMVNKAPIVTIFDVPHLLKCTRNALLTCNIEFEPNKFANFDHILNTYNLDKTKRTYRCLNKLNDNHFNMKDSFMKMKVSVAARQLSHTMAAAIETFYSCGYNGEAGSLQTAEFIHNIDNLFDSLNSNQFYACEGKKYRCALSDGSPHLEFWSEILSQLYRWKIWDKNSKKIRNDFHFVRGWQITIRAIMLLWKNLKEMGLKFLCLRNLNQDPIENFFGQIRQHGITNTNPTCFQFKAALKTLIITNFSSPLSKNSNCEEDFCTTLGDFSGFLEKYLTEKHSSLDQTHDIEEDLDPSLEDQSFIENNPANAYVAGYLLKKVNPNPSCHDCQKLFSDNISEKHVFVSFKEYDTNTRLKYASENILELLETLDSKLFDFLDNFGTSDNLEFKFKQKYSKFFDTYQVCQTHIDYFTTLINKAIRLGIYKYIKKFSEKSKNNQAVSKGHKSNLKKFKSS